MIDHIDNDLVRLFGFTAAQLSSLKENGVWTNSRRAADTMPKEFERDEDGNLICTISHWAQVHDLTHQRANQLATLGVLAVVRRGYCNFSESQSRYIAYLRDEKLRASSRGNAQRRDATYYSMEGRTIELKCGGATPGELRALCEVTNTLLHRIADVDAIVRYDAKSLSDDAAAKLQSLARTAGNLAVTLAGSCDQAYNHAFYIHMDRSPR